MRLRLFALFTICGLVVVGVTMTFAPVLSKGAGYSSRIGLLALFAALWWAARGDRPLSRFRPVFFAYFTVILALSLGYFIGDWALWLLGLTTQTPRGIAVAKFSQASVIVVAVLITARLCGEKLSSLYIRKGRLLASLTIGFLGAAVCAVLSFQQPATRTLGITMLAPLIPWILLFVVSNGFMEELVFRGLFLGRYEPLVGSWMAILSTATVFTLAHMQASYTPDILVFLVVLLVLAVAWGWLMQRTETLWGSALFHAGADLLVILPIFKSLGAV